MLSQELSNPFVKSRVSDSPTEYARFDRQGVIVLEKTTALKQRYYTRRLQIIDFSFYIWCAHYIKRSEDM